MSGHLSLRIGLLDMQVVDSNRLPIGRVDDLELELPAGGARPRVVALLTGAQALGERLRGIAGRSMAGAARRLRGPDAPDGPASISTAIVDGVGAFVRLGVPLAELEDVARLERWLAEHVVEPAPGAGDARQ